MCSIWAMKYILLFIVMTFCAHAEDWTVNGKTFQNVTVGRVEADRVHIVYNGGIGTVLIADLSPEIRARFSFDPAKAKAEAVARETARAQAEAQLAAEAAARPKPVETSIPSTTEARKPAVNTAALQVRMNALQEDINFLERQQITVDSRRYTRGAYADRLASDQAELTSLQAQLH